MQIFSSTCKKCRSTGFQATTIIWESWIIRVFIDIRILTITEPSRVHIEKGNITKDRSISDASQISTDKIVISSVGIIFIAMIVVLEIATLVEILQTKFIGRKKAHTELALECAPSFKIHWNEFSVTRCTDIPPGRIIGTKVRRVCREKNPFPI